MELRVRVQASSADALTALPSGPPVALEDSPKPKAACLIHVEYAHGSSTDGSKADDRNVDLAEMLFPTVLTRVKEDNDFTGCRIEASEVRPFVGIATLASECEIGYVITTAVLTGNNMLHVEDREREIFLF